MAYQGGTVDLCESLDIKHTLDVLQHMHEPYWGLRAVHMERCHRVDRVQVTEQLKATNPESLVSECCARRRRQPLTA